MVVFMVVFFINLYLADIYIRRFSIPLCLNHFIDEKKINYTDKDIINDPKNL